MSELDKHVGDFSTDYEEETPEAATKPAEDSSEDLISDYMNGDETASASTAD